MYDINNDASNGTSIIESRTEHLWIVSCILLAYLPFGRLRLQLCLCMTLPSKVLFIVSFFNFTTPLDDIPHAFPDPFGPFGLDLGINLESLGRMPHNPLLELFFSQGKGSRTLGRAGHVRLDDLFARDPPRPVLAPGRLIAFDRRVLHLGHQRRLAENFRFGSIEPGRHDLLLVQGRVVQARRDPSGNFLLLFDQFVKDTVDHVSRRRGLRRISIIAISHELAFAPVGRVYEAHQERRGHGQIPIQLSLQILILLRLPVVPEGDLQTRRTPRVQHLDHPFRPAPRPLVPRGACFVGYGLSENLIDLADGRLRKSPIQQFPHRPAKRGDGLWLGL